MIWYFKSNQKQNNRNRKEIKERERRKLPGATYLAQHGPAHLHSPPLSSSSASRQRRGVARAREASATSCFPWPPPASSRRPGPRPRRHAPSQASHSPRAFSPPFSGSLSLPPSGAPSPPTPFAAATTTASPPRRLPKLRRSSLFLLTKTEGAGSPGWGQLRRSPPRPPRIAAVKFVPVRPPSSSPSTSTGST